VVWAQAAARAIIEGDCLNGQAVAELLLEADALDITGAHPSFIVCAALELERPEEHPAARS